MSQFPAVATVIPAYKSRYLDEVIASLERQSLLPAEVVIVDDGSPTPVKVPPSALPITTITHEINNGTSAARNTGVRSTTSPLLHILDHDEIVEPDFYARLLPHFARDEIGIAFGITGLM